MDRRIGAAPEGSNPPARHRIGEYFLRAASRVVDDLHSVDDLLQVIMDKVIEVTRATKGFVVLLDANQELDVRVARNIEREEVTEPHRISRKMIGQVIASGEGVLTGNARDDPRFQSMDSVRRLVLRSILCVPLRKPDGEVRGVIYLENHLTAGVFTAEDREVLERVAEEASLALGLSQTFEAIRGERDRLESENEGLREIFRSRHDAAHLVGRSAVMSRLAAQLSRFARSHHSVLIQGESGTGKELVARILHTSSPRRGGPFVAVNCAAVPTGIFESELFGHVRGAFTGAERNRAGKIETADGGTLFLDEIGDLQLELQAKLLRLLEQRTYERVGEDGTRYADIRVVSATNKNLRDEVDAGRFRGDLYWRLNELPLIVPPLRDHLEDVPELAQHFLREEGCKSAGFERAAIEFMMSQPWPGNVRELRNVIIRAAVFTADDTEIGAETMRAMLEPGRGQAKSRTGCAGLNLAVPDDLAYRDAIQHLEKEYLREMMLRNESLSRADLAKRLGIAKRTLFQRLRALGLNQ